MSQVWTREMYEDVLRRRDELGQTQLEIGVRYNVTSARIHIVERQARAWLIQREKGVKEPLSVRSTNILQNECGWSVDEITQDKVREKYPSRQAIFVELKGAPNCGVKARNEIADWAYPEEIGSRVMAKQKVYKNESDVKKEVKRILNHHKFFWWMPPANAFGKSGIADFQALRGGVFLAIETKFGYNKPTPMQLAFLNSVNAESGFAFVVDESNVDHLDRWLMLFGRSAEALSRNEKIADEDGAEMLDCLKALTEKLT
jgi:hypothetical protein